MFRHLSNKEAYKILNCLGVSELYEILQLIANLRQSCRFIMLGAKEPVFAELIYDLGLFYVKSEFPVKRGDDGTNKSSFILKYDKSEDYLYCFYLAKSTTISMLALACEANDSDMQGKLFGYPKCCTNFFKDKFCSSHQDIIYQIALPVNSYKFWNNRIFKSSGYSLISHFPCSWDCYESEFIAKQTYLQLKISLPEHAEKVLININQNLLYSTNDVICLGANKLESVEAFDEYFADSKTSSKYIYLPFYQAKE